MFFFKSFARNFSVETAVFFLDIWIQFFFWYLDPGFFLYLDPGFFLIFRSRFFFIFGSRFFLYLNPGFFLDPKCGINSKSMPTNAYWYWRNMWTAPYGLQSWGSKYTKAHPQCNDSTTKEEKAFKQCYIQSTLTHVISQSGKVLIFLVAISSTVRFKWTTYHKHNFLLLGPLSSQPLSLIQDWTTFSASFTTFSSSDRQNTWRLSSWRREGSVVLWFVKFNQVEGKVTWIWAGQNFFSFCGLTRWHLL